MATYTDGSIVYEVSIDTKNMMQNSTKVREELNRLNANGKNASKGLDQVEQSADRASQSMFKLSTIAKAVSAALVSSQVISYTQSWNELEDRIANTGATAYQTKEIMDQLLETSNRNGRSIEESSELYIRLSNSMKEMGYSTNDTLSYIDTLSNLLTINKTSTMAAESAMNALTPAQMKGKISGLEAESVFNAMPSILQTLAKQFSKTGKAVKEIDVRNMAKNGEISMRQFSAAIIAAQEDTAALADNMRNNVNDGITRITNNLKKYFGELNNATGGTRLIVDALILMSQHVNILATGVGVLGAIYAGKYVTSLAAATKQSVSKTLADINQAKSEKAAAAAALEQAKAETTNALAAQKSLAAQLALAQTEQTRNALRQQIKANTVTLTAAVDAEAAAQARLAAAAKTSSFAMNGLKSAMNLLGGPAGILLIAAGAMYSWIASSSAAIEKAADLSVSIDELKRQFNELTLAGKRVFRDDLKKEIQKIDEALSDVDSRIKQVNKNMNLRMSTRLTNVDLSDLQEQLDELLNKKDLIAENKGKKVDLLGYAESEINDLTNGVKKLNEEVGKVKSLPIDTTAYDKQLEALNSLLDKKKEGIELSKVNAEIENGIFKDLEPQQKAELQRVADLVDKMRERQKLEKERQVAEGQKFAEQQFNDSKSPLEQIEIDEKAKKDRLDAWRATGKADEQKYQDALTAIKLDAENKRDRIDKESIKMKAASVDAMLSATSSLFGGIADIMKVSEGEQSSSYKAMFAIAKGFQIAQATMNFAGAVMAAFNAPDTLTLPQKMANVAAATAAGGSLLSQVASISYGGGRLNGGGVTGGTMYRVGENNKPEIFQSGGKQYMIPGENGRVFSNNEVTGNSSQSLNWTFIVENNASGVEVSQPDVNREKMIVKWAVNEVANSVRNKQGDVWNALKSTTNVTPRLR